MIFKVSCMRVHLQLCKETLLLSNPIGSYRTTGSWRKVGQVRFFCHSGSEWLFFNALRVHISYCAGSLGSPGITSHCIPSYITVERYRVETERNSKSRNHEPSLETPNSTT